MARSRGLAPMSRLLVPLVLLVACARLGAAVNIIPSQAAVLEQVGQAWNFSFWAPGMNWTEPWECGEVGGVVCNGQGSIVQLILAGGNSIDNTCSVFPPSPRKRTNNYCPLPIKLTGPLPVGLSALTTLKILDLNTNSFSGTIPSELFSFPNLEALYLGGNQGLAGSVPNEISNLGKLQVLDLGYLNQLNGTLPTGMGALTALTKLNLYSMTAKGAIPSEFGALTGLQNLNMAGMTLSGPLPNAFSALTNLSLLQIQQNKFNGTLPEYLSTMTSLTTLQMQFNSFTGPVPTWIGELTKLDFLNLAYTRLSGPLPPTLSQLPIRSPEGGAAGNSFILFTDTKTTCPVATRTACEGPPPVNTTSQFCVQVCPAFCDSCGAKNYTGANTPGSSAGDQPVVGEITSPPPAPPSPPSPPLFYFESPADPPVTVAGSGNSDVSGTPPAVIKQNLAAASGAQLSLLTTLSALICGIMYISLS